jgi:hypothetical protein
MPKGVKNSVVTIEKTIVEEKTKKSSPSAVVDEAREEITYEGECLFCPAKFKNRGLKHAHLQQMEPCKSTRLIRSNKRTSWKNSKSRPK